ncbi:c-type cytochrome biogenesis protein CcmI [uncultured Martelella sp.]|uniref:c-type cytochrome biogenesis protein CcmI n=1 Tax=uncultured Martelella sp. TaxID=392331 RepID=UPI0029C6E566|nr:c-type cytochrome biogenesis protein CcmI [uncultured Martelella sp.]
MIFATVALVMLLVAAVAVALPLFRQSGLAEDDAAAGQAAVYRDQLLEIERERRDGLLSEQQYEASRAEIGRRLLAVDDSSSKAGGPGGNQSFMRWGAIAAIVVLMIGGGLVYPLVGKPGASDQPLAARMNADEPDLAVLVARVEQHLAEHPDDGRGWDVIAPIYLRENRFEDAQDAYANAIRVSGPTAERLAGLGEAIVAVNAGVVTDEALDVFRQAEAIDPDELRTLYFIALAAEQSGDFAVAVERFERLQAALPANSPWRDMVASRIAQNNQQLADNGVVANGPDEEAVAAAAELSTQARADMIDGMVSGLEQRLDENPDDIDGWMRLIRSYAVLGQQDKAALALAEAIGYYGEGSEVAARLTAFGDSLQVSGVEP